MEVRKTDRRKNNVAVEVDRRSGVDRRENPSLFYALEATVPTFRRVASIPNKLNDDDKIGAMGSIGLALINIKEDCRTVKEVINQIKGEKPSYDHYNYQHSCSFFKDTIIEEWLVKKVKAGKKWAHLLYENDRTLADMPIINKVLKPKDIIETPITNIKGHKALGYKYGENLFIELTGRALRRTTKLSLITMGLLEIPKIITSEDKTKQTEKSAINIASTTLGISYGGAIGSKYAGNLGSIVGMGLGAILGNKLSNKLQDAI